ncbi:Arr3 protein [Martiniozyma asiatica (nom. inval.)]|nr:Arr3 protein [Martiniozyma asiatica]
MKSSFTFVKAFNRLSLIDKILPLAILLAIVAGILISVYVSSSRNAFDGAQVVGVSIPLAVGLIIMMIPPLCKVQWENLHIFFAKKEFIKPILISLIINWILCPFLMFGIAWLTLFDNDEYRTGIIMIGMARCIAMVLIWNEIAGGDNTLCAIIVIVNSLLQIVLYAPYQLFFCYVITGNYQHQTDLSYSIVAKSVAFFLGVPFGIGLLIRLIGFFTLGIEKYNKKIIPFISPWALIGLLYTIIIIFIEKGNDFIQDIGSGFRCFIPLVVYFLITWFGTFFILRKLLGKTPRQKLQGENEGEDDNDDDDETQLLCGCEKELEKSTTSMWAVQNCSASYKQIVTLAFTAASNNFELSLAVAISVYGNGSKEAIAATFGPLVEVPILLLLCFVAKYFQMKLLWSDVEYDDDNNNIDEIQLSH